MFTVSSSVNHVDIHHNLKPCTVWICKVFEVQVNSISIIHVDFKEQLDYYHIKYILFIMI